MEERRCSLPPGFRFHPTEEELIHFYLKRKVRCSISGTHAQDFEFDHIIPEVHLNQLEPWDIQEKCKVDTTHQTEWYFFTHKDKKYTTGMRTNRATKEGFWKATGRDKPVVSSCTTLHDQDERRLLHIGMRKTLVYYKGRAPHGIKSNWIMHEFRLLQLLENKNALRSYSSQEDGGWVLCRVFKKSHYDERRTYGQVNSTFSDVDESIDKMYGSETSMDNENMEPRIKNVFCKQEFVDELPQLESPKINPNISNINLYDNGIGLHSNITLNDFIRANLVETSGPLQRKAYQVPLYPHHLSIQEYLLNQSRNFNMVEEDMSQCIENTNTQVLIDGAYSSSYDNFIKSHGLEGINPVTNDPFFLHSTTHISRIHPSLDNCSSNNEIELWNFSR